MKLLAAFSVRAKLTSSFGLLVLLLLAIAASALLALQQSNQRFSGYVHGLNARATLAGHVREAVDRRAIAARNLVFATLPQDVQEERTAALAASADVERYLAALHRQIEASADVSPQARGLFAAIENVEKQYAPVAATIVEHAAAGRREEAIRAIQEQCRPLLVALVKATGDYAAFTEARAQELTEEAETSFVRQRDRVIALCLAAIALAAASGYLITRDISTGLIGAVRAANTIASGDLSQAIVVRSRDETGRLLGAVQEMQACLNHTVSDVRSNAESVASASAQIALGNHDLSHRTEEQASALQQTAASMEQLSQAVSQNAENARQADAYANQASDIATSCGSVVGEVVRSMRQIQQSSQRIHDIVGVIDGIAFQTNILALNAAVEAARAGQHGRGFAVVASEVRTLATRSADAAREVKKLVNDNVSEVERGTALSDGAGDTMREVVVAIQRVTELIGEISAASREQSLGVGQVKEAIHIMDDATQRNAALVEESAAAAAGLESQARRLLAAVSIFKQGDASAAPAASVARRTAGAGMNRLALA